MEILTDYNQLKGKTIAFVHMAQFADQITIATEDKKVLMATMDINDDGEQQEIRVLYPAFVMQRLKKDEWMRKELAKLGIFDMEAYRKEEEAKLEERKRVAAKEKVQRDLKLLAELKALYEPETVGAAPGEGENS